MNARTALLVLLPGLSLGLLAASCSDADTPTSVVDRLPTSSPSTRISPEDYVELHSRAVREGPARLPALRELAELGDEFTRHYLGEIDRSAWSADEKEAAEQSLAQIEARLQAPMRIASIGPLLERAAWSDLRCHPLEHQLPPWIQETLTELLTLPPIRAELERLQREFEPYTKDSVGFGYLDQRVQRYIERILAARE